MIKPTILVTGGAGYIGSHVCIALADAGFVPVSYDDLRTGHRELVRWGPFEFGSLHDAARLSEVIAEHRPLACVHLAGSCYVAESVAQPQMYWQNNVLGSEVLIECLSRAGVSRIVFSSSCTVYGEPTTMRVSEQAEKSPINPYGTTKLEVERRLEGWSQSGHGQFVALRYFNAAGADRLGRTGEAHEPETHLIPLALIAAAHMGPALDILGDDWDTPDGTCIRDFVHVADVAYAHLLAVRHLLDGGLSMALNLGSGSGRSVRDVIEACGSAVGRAVPFAVKARRVGDAAVLVADARAAAQRLGWEPRESNLDLIVASAWNWLRQQEMRFGRPLATHGPPR